MDCVRLGVRGPVGFGKALQSLDNGGRARGRIGQYGRHSRNRDSTAHVSVLVEVAQQCFRHIATGIGHDFHRSELGRLVLVDPPRQGISDGHLRNHGHTRDRERDDETDPVVPIAPAPQQADRIDGRNEEAADDIGGNDHVRRLKWHGLVEDDFERIDLGDVAAASRVNPEGVFIQALAAMTDALPRMRRGRSGCR